VSASNQTSSIDEQQWITLQYQLTGARARRPHRPMHRLAPLAVILLTGALLRLALALPVYQYPAEADALLGPLTARAVLEGEWPIFLTPARHGAIGGYLMAGLFLLVGETREAIHLHPLLIQLATMLVWLAFCREILGRWDAPGVGAMIAFAPPAVLFWTSMPNPYPEVLLSCAAILWTGARLERRPDRAGWGWFGLAVGLGLWMSIQTLCCTIPVGIWLLLRRRWPRPLDLLTAVVTVVVGSLPWWLAQWGPPEGRLSANFAAEPADRGELLANLRYLITENVPELLASGGVTGPGAGIDGGLMWVRWLIIASSLTLAAWGVASAHRDDPTNRSAVTLSLLVMAFVVLLNLASSAGSVRGLTVRYVMPAILVLPLLVSLGLSAVPRWRRAITFLFVPLLLVWNLIVLPLPGTPERALWRQGLASQARVVEELERRGVEVAIGNYWAVYPLNYLSRGILGIPCHLGSDILRIADRPRPDPTPIVALVQPHGAEAQLALALGSDVASLTTAGGAIGRAPDLPLSDLANLVCSPPLPTPTFSDGFESGDTTAWSAPTVPPPTSPEVWPTPDTSP
jgi:hypothetical protein